MGAELEQQAGTQVEREEERGAAPRQQGIAPGWLVITRLIWRKMCKPEHFPLNQKWEKIEKQFSLLKRSVNLNGNR